MIKLIVNPESSHPESFQFSDSEVLVGSGCSFPNKLCLVEDHLQEVHVKILEQNGLFFAVNVTNDPFVTLNGTPFGKRPLSNGDLLNIGHHQIRFEGKSEFILLAPPPISIIQESYADELPPLEEQGKSQDVSDHHEDKEEEEVQHPILHNPSRHWLSILKMFFGGILIISFILAFVYVKALSRSEKEKMIAAEGVADVSMALAYAQMHHLKPQKQNWSDPDFLKNNLVSVLSSEYPSFAHLDSQGQFQNCPYLLRIYTSNDLSQFIVIAQPEPSVLQWLIPKAAVILDSNTMEMRTTNDLKALNRLLVNANVLDGTNALEISHLVHQEKLLPLTSLGSKKGFAPPKVLAVVRPGAENLVYNAPRYYQFGESLLKKANFFLQMISSGQEVERLQQEITELTRFPNIVLYSSQGIHKATEAQKALSTLAPNVKFLTAYLNFTSQGAVASSHLLLDDDSPFSSFKREENRSLMATADLPNESKQVAHSILDEKIQTNPIVIHFTQLLTERQHSLKEVTDELNTTLIVNTEKGIANFPILYPQLLEKYMTLDRSLREKIHNEIISTYMSKNISSDQLLTFINMSGLEILAQDALKELPNKKIFNEDQLIALLDKIPQSQDFESLDNAVTESAIALDTVILPTNDKQLFYQNKLRSRTIQKLGKLIFSQKSPSPNGFHEENKERLSHILKTALINDPEEYNFYMDEFELRAKTAKRR